MHGGHDSDRSHRRRGTGGRAEPNQPPPTPIQTPPLQTYPVHMDSCFSVSATVTPGRFFGPLTITGQCFIANTTAVVYLNDSLGSDGIAEVPVNGHGMFTTQLTPSGSEPYSIYGVDLVGKAYFSPETQAITVW